MHILETLDRCARESRLEFLVIGGHAVIHYGYPRETGDLDLLVRKDQRQDWLTLFASLAYTLFREGEIFLQLTPPSGNAWPVDLMLVNRETFDKMRASAVRVDFASANGWIPCLEHLIALKLHALKSARVHRFPKDFQDVEGMVRKNNLDLQSERMRELFRKYGTMDLYEKIVRACSDA